MDLSESEYPNTVLHLSEGARIDLREPIGAAAREIFSRHGLRGPFAILSAYPAPSQSRSREASEHLAARLQRVIRAFDVDMAELLASSPCGAHTEPSVAAALTRRDALAIARLFDQAALFWFDGERIWIDWTDGRASTELPIADAAFKVSGLRAGLDESDAH